MPHAAIPFRPHHRFAVPLPRSRRGGLVTRRFLAESRNISSPRRCGGSGERSEPIGALMPHAALRVVQQDREVCMPAVQQSFNAARGFAGDAARPHGLWLHHPCIVSMPHAALWVVQQGYPYWKVAALAKFQCRTRLCGWCSLTRTTAPAWALVVSMPHAALWVVQRNGRLRYRQILEVSMPHAALWVVQPL